MEPRRTHEKIIRTHEVLTGKILDPRSTHEKIFGTDKYPREKLWDPQSSHEKKFQTHKIPTRKNSEQTKAPWIDGVRPTRLKMGRDPRNLAHSKISTAKIYSKKLLCQRLLFLFLWPLKSFVITKHEIIYHKNLHKKICSAKVFCFLFL